ncbi:stage V sporulation protein AA [Jeotgalibacillus proteolyticus]|uniref:Stage V sporulation protein AA n=1 Tax=Jeotgalibacillus proteolyticus TaxID=2082395 RepID=A0A2S5GED6_9BACL|nr:stage V sporulation protein AA [Jeotgalibacillus proteolyticus]PPA71308.1 stage V sporulation protein AA [Jeotgalibacillus proteolyticus]
MSQTVYIRLKRKINVLKGHVIMVKDAADISAPGLNVDKLKKTPMLATKKNSSETYLLIDQVDMIDQVKKVLPAAEIDFLGASATLVELREEEKKGSLPLFLFVWSLLFVGAALTIMYFHEDVSMRETQISMVQMMTGKKLEHPLWFQIPYSIGLGLGMILFFNRLFQKKFNEEPSPLDVEVFNYEQSLEDYIVDQERKKLAQNDQ